jgi:hypothetical protein
LKYKQHRAKRDDTLDPARNMKKDRDVLKKKGLVAG